MKAFSIGEAFSFAREYTVVGIKKAWKLFCLQWILAFGGLIFNLKGTAFLPSSKPLLFGFLGWAIYFMTLCFSTYVVYVLIRVFYEQLSSASLSRDSWTRIAEKIWAIAVAGIITGMVTTFGLLLLILPGLYIGARLCLFTYFICIKESGIKESLAASFKATKDNAIRLIVLLLLLMLLYASTYGIVWLLVKGLFSPLLFWLTGWLVGDAWAIVFTAAVGQVLSIFLMVPFSLAVFTHVFYQLTRLQERKEPLVDEKAL